MTSAIESMSSSQALELLRAELLAMDPRTVMPPNADAAGCAMEALGTLRTIRLYQADLVALCGEERAGCIDRLEVVAWATVSAQARWRASVPVSNIPALSSELSKVRETLVGEARGLARRGFLDERTLHELSVGHGHKNLCLDVLQLVTVLQTSWEAIERVTHCTPEELAQAENLADKLTKALAEKDRGELSPDADLRNRAWTLLVQTYDDVRRLITYLRWKEGDMDEIAPSLWAARGAKARQTRRFLRAARETLGRDRDQRVIDRSW